MAAGWCHDEPTSWYCGSRHGCGYRGNSLSDEVCARCGIDWQSIWQARRQWEEEPRTPVCHKEKGKGKGYSSRCVEKSSDFVVETSSWTCSSSTDFTTGYAQAQHRDYQEASAAGEGGQVLGGPTQTKARESDWPKEETGGGEQAEDTDCRLLRELVALVKLADTNVCRTRAACEVLAHAHRPAKDTADPALQGAMEVRRAAKAVLEERAGQLAGGEAKTDGGSLRKSQSKVQNESPCAYVLAEGEDAPLGGNNERAPGCDNDYFASPPERPVSSRKLREVYFAMAAAYGIVSPQTQEAFAALRTVEEKEAVEQRQNTCEGHLGDMAKGDALPQTEAGYAGKAQDHHEQAGVAWRRPPRSGDMEGVHAEAQDRSGQLHPSKWQPLEATPQSENRPYSAEEVATTLWPRGQAGMTRGLHSTGLAQRHSASHGSTTTRMGKYHSVQH